MKANPRVAIVGVGRLGSSLALALAEAGYGVGELIVRHRNSTAASLARKLGAQLNVPRQAILNCDVVWFCVPDSAIACTAAAFREREWKGKTALHPSGALSSQELAALRARGAQAASAHPMMTFAGGTQSNLEGVPFALEGDAAAIRTAQRIVRGLGGYSFVISARAKPLYHAWGGFLSPLLVAHLACGEKIANAAGIPVAKARRNMLPILAQTIVNYARLGPGASLTGPLARGDVGTIQRHLDELRKISDVEEVYRALSRFAVRELPVKKGREVEKLLSPRRKTSGK